VRVIVVIRIVVFTVLVAVVERRAKQVEGEAEVDEDYSVQKQEHRSIVKGLGEEADELCHVGVQLEVETCLADHECQLNHVCEWHKWVERLRLVH